MHPLLHQIAVIAGRARRLLLWRGLARWGCGVLVVAFLAAVADYLFRFDESGLRWLATGVVLSAAVAGWVRWVGPVWAFRRSDEAVAAWIERRFPELQDRLTSAIAFLRQPADDQRFGSQHLRQALVREVTESIRNRDLLACLDSRTTKRAAAWLLLVVVLVGGISALDVRSSALAARRLAMPWGDDAWPRRNWLVFTSQPKRLAAGQDFAVELTDKRGWLPSAVTIHYWFEGDADDHIRSHRMLYAGGKMTHTLPQVTRSFRYRATGGDDETMEWIALRVVEPPRLVASEIRLHPPAYSGLPVQSSDRPIRGIAGTHVEITGRVSRPIASASLQFQSNGRVQAWPASVAGDGLTFRLPSTPANPWVLADSGTYHWTVVDREGLAVLMAAETAVEVRADMPPTITVESPRPDAGFTPQAQVPFRLVVKDDLAVQRVVLRAGDQSLTIDEREMPPAAASEQAWPPRGEQRVVERLVDLQQWPSLQAGQSLVVRLIATDFRPQDSEPVEITLSLLTPEGLKTRIDQRQLALLQRLNDTLRLQRSVRSQANALQATAAASTPTAADLAALPSMELGQQRVRNQLDGDQGAIRIVRELLSDLTNNRVTDVSLAGHLSSVQEALLHLAGDLLPPIEQQLGQAARLEPASAPPPAATNSAAFSSKLPQELAGVVRGQDEVIHALEELVDRLGQWSGYRLLAQEVAQLQFEQETRLAETRALPTAGKELIELTDEESVAVRRLSEQQHELATQLDRMQQRLERMRQQFGEGDPVATSAMDAALRLLREEATSARMREAARELSQNRPGSAAAGQEQVLAGLQRLYDVLAHRPEQDLARVAAGLREAAREVGQLRERQAIVEKQSSEAESLSGDTQRRTLQEVSRSEREIAEAVEQLARRVQRLTPAGAERLAAAATRLRGAAQSAEQGHPAETTAGAHDAAMQLGEVQQLLQRDAAAAERQEAKMQHEFLSQNLQSLHESQRALVEATEQLGEQRSPDGQLPPAGREEAAQLSGRQHELAETTRGVARRMASLAAVAQAVEGAADAMERASRRLAERQVDPETTSAQRLALDRLRQLLDAVHPASNQPAENQRLLAPGEENVPSDAGGMDLTQLKVLRGWQLEINRRTAEVADAVRDAQSPNPDQQRELADLTTEQQRVAELLEQLLAPSRPPHAVGPRSPVESEVERGLDDALRKTGVPGFEDPKPQAKGPRSGQE